MAEEETRVGHQVVSEGGEQPTATHQTQPQAEVFFSRDEAQRAGAAPTPPPPQPRDEAERGGASPAEADRITADQEDPFAEKPHLYALGAFAGAFVVAQVLKRLTGGDE
jgi:hypothetical protein